MGASRGQRPARASTNHAQIAYAREDGHTTLFLRLAEQVADAATVASRLDQLLDGEAELVTRLPIRAAVH